MGFVPAVGLVSFALLRKCLCQGLTYKALSVDTKCFSPPSPDGRNWAHFCSGSGKNLVSQSGQHEGIKFSACPCTLSNSWVTVKTKHEILFPCAPSYVCPVGEQLQLCGSGHAVVFGHFFFSFSVL